MLTRQQLLLWLVDWLYDDYFLLLWRFAFVASEYVFIVTYLNVWTTQVTVCACHAELKGYFLTYLISYRQLTNCDSQRYIAHSITWTAASATVWKSENCCCDLYLSSHPELSYQGSAHVYSHHTDYVQNVPVIKLSTNDLNGYNFDVGLRYAYSSTSSILITYSLQCTLPCGRMRDLWANIARGYCVPTPTQHAFLTVRGRLVSAGESWEWTGIPRSVLHVTVVLQLRLVSGWGLQRSAPPYGLMRPGKDSIITTT